MSTHSGIGYVENDGTVRSIYCHFDGYPDGVGLLLTTHYNNLESAEKIVALGSLSHLDKRLDPIGPHSFDKPEKGTTVAYHRDRDEEMRFEVWSGQDEYLSEADDYYCADYLYLFKDGEWICLDTYTQEVIDL